jgi:DNA-binding PadR family transcriptional regulator
MTPQQRVEALISGVCNNFSKAIALYVLEKGKNYTGMELDHAVERFLGEEALPFSRGMLRKRCEQSLKPIGFVAEKEVMGEKTHSGKWVKAYAITEDGERYGKPSIEQFLLLADYLGKSLNEINGVENTAGAVKHGYVVAELLGILHDGRIHTETEIAKLMGFNKMVVCASLRHLAELGLAEYRSVSKDAYGGSESSYSIAGLVSRKKLKAYLADDETLRMDVLNVRSIFKFWGHLTSTLKLELEELDCNALAGELGIAVTSASRVIAVLCDLGVYAYKNFDGKYTQSEAKITEDGMKCFEMAYKPVLLVAEDPLSSSAFGEYESVLKDRSEAVRLFKSEEQRYLDTSNLLDKQNGEDNVALVLDTIHEAGLLEFRRKDLVDVLRKKRDGRDIPVLISHQLPILLNGGIIEKRTDRHGYYRLVRKEETE